MTQSEPRHRPSVGFIWRGRVGGFGVETPFSGRKVGFQVPSLGSFGAGAPGCADVKEHGGTQIAPQYISVEQVEIEKCELRTGREGPRSRKRRGDVGR